MSFPVSSIAKCPFCGTDKHHYIEADGIRAFSLEVLQYEHGSQVFCRVCEARGPVGTTDMQAVKRWNGRGGA